MSPRRSSTLRACLKPGGVLILLEETRFFPWFDLGMGLQSGFDTRTDFGLRPVHPLLARAGWIKALGAAGFGRPRRWRCQARSKT